MNDFQRDLDAAAERARRFFADARADALRRLADAVLQSCGGRCAVFSGEGENYKYAIGQKGGDLRSFAKELNGALKGRGGGKPEFIQGSVNANKTQIEAFFGGTLWFR